MLGSWREHSTPREQIKNIKCFRGCALLHAYGAALDHPDLIVACAIGDGEAEIVPIAASWHSSKFRNRA